MQAKNQLENIAKVTSLVTADFSTLFTSLPHEEIKKYTLYIVGLVMKNYNYICGNYRDTWPSNKLYSNGFCLTQHEISILLDMVLENSVVTFAGFFFQQTSGIPMGGNASAELADLTLSGMEYQYMTNNVNQDRRQNDKTARYMDDLINANCPDFLETCKKIYPPSLPLSETSVSPTESNYLDLEIKVANSKVIFSVYNKTDDFDFTVTRYVHADSNVARSVGLNTFRGQLVRIARISSTAEAFQARTKELYDACREKGFHTNELNSCVHQVWEAWKPLLAKFGYQGRNACQDFIRSTLFN